MTIGQRLKALRESLGLNQVEFAKKLNVSKQTLYKYERDIITTIPYDKIELAAQLANISPASILGWEKEFTPLEKQIIVEYRKSDDSTKELVLRALSIIHSLN